MQPKNIKALQQESKQLRVLRLKKNVYAVASASDQERGYMVRVAFDRDGRIYAQCDCPWSQHHGVACSHVLAVLSHLAAKKRRRLSFWLTAEDAERQKQRRFYLTQTPKSAAKGVWITSRQGE